MRNLSILTLTGSKSLELLIWKGSFENEALEKKTEARSTQISKMKHPRLENEAPKFRNLSVLYKHETTPCQVTNAKTAGIKHDNE